MINILAVDDDPQVLKSINKILADAGYNVSMAASGPEALEMIKRQKPDLVVLDIIMPEMDGVEVCRRLRADPFLARLPIIFLTAKGRPTDIVEGLDAGADDFLTKPFEVVELPARIRALLRRAPGGTLDPESDSITTGRVQLYTTRMELVIDGEMIELTSTEHRLMHCLMLHGRQPVPVEQLLQDVWQYPPGVGDPKLVHVHIGKLRAKIEPDPDSPRYILNVRGQGYLVSG